MSKHVNTMASKDESHSYSSEDTKDDSGDLKVKHFKSFHPNEKFIREKTIIIKSSKLKLVATNSVNNKYEDSKATEIILSSDVDKYKKENFIPNSRKKVKGKFSLTDLNNNNYKEFLLVKQAFTTFNYPFVQDLRGPIYYTRGKNNAIFIAKIRKVQSIINKSIFDKGLKYLYRAPKDVPDMKFWHQRFYYYSKFDEGIKMDYESWYSVTPEDLAFYIAKIAGKNSVCIDPFAGSGGNVIQFSKFCQKVYSVDIDPVKIDILQNNVKVYKCPENIEIIHHDFLKLEMKISVSTF